MTKRIFIILTLGLSFAATYAQILHINECVRLARDHYPVIAQYDLLDRVHRIDLANLSKAWLPQGNVSAQLSWQNDVAAIPDVLTGILSQHGVDYPGLSKTQYRAGADISQQIWDGGKTSATRRSIRTADDMKRNSLDVQMYDVEERVEELYFAILLLDERIHRADKTIALMDSTLRQVQSMYANGTAMKCDCDQIEAQLLGFRQQRIQLSAARDSYRRIMEIFIGEAIGNRRLQLPASDAIPKSDYDRPQMRLFDARLRHIESQQACVKAASMPTIGAFASGYYGYPGYNMFKNMQSRDMSFNFMAGIRVSWNFSSLYTRKKSLAKLAMQRDKIEIERKTFLFNNSMLESESIGKIAAMQEVMKHDARIVELRRSVMNAARSQLRNGVIDTTSLLSKITDEELAENDLTLHHIELCQTLYHLNHIRNK